MVDWHLAKTFDLKITLLNATIIRGYPYIKPPFFNIVMEMDDFTPILGF
jgi:hypothetical protein